MDAKYFDNVSKHISDMQQIQEDIKAKEEEKKERKLAEREIFIIKNQRKTDRKYKKQISKKTKSKNK